MRLGESFSCKIFSSRVTHKEVSFYFLVVRTVIRIGMLSRLNSFRMLLARKRHVASLREDLPETKATKDGGRDLT